MIPDTATNEHSFKVGLPAPFETKAAEKAIDGQGLQGSLCVRPPRAKAHRKALTRRLDPTVEFFIVEFFVAQGETGKAQLGTAMNAEDHPPCMSFANPRASDVKL